VDTLFCINYVLIFSAASREPRVQRQRPAITTHYQKFQSFVAVPSITPLLTQQQENKNVQENVHVLYDGINNYLK
jgi:hypothetical protein